MRALAYFRADPGLSPGHAMAAAALTRALTAYFDLHSHVGHGVFGDEATADDAPGYRKMVDRIHSSGLAYLVVVPSADHLGRVLTEQVERVLELDALNCQVVCADPDMPDPIQGALRALKVQGLSGSRRQAIREGMKAKAAQALALGKPPYGYRVGAEGVLEPVPAQADVVRSIFAMYLDQGVGVRTIARWLNEKGVLTRRGRVWSMVTVRDVLRNHAYIGTYQRFGLRIPASHQPIVGLEEFRSVQDHMASRSPGRRYPKSEPFLLTGLLYCGYCGQRMMGVVRHQTWRRKGGERVRREYRYYQCQSRVNRSQCQYHTQQAAQLEEQVREHVQRHFTDASAPIPSVQAQGADGKDRAMTQVKLRALEQRYIEWVQRAADGAILLHQLRNALHQLEAERRVLADRRSLEDGDPAQLQEWRKSQRQLLEEDEWDALEVAQRQEVFRGLVSRVVVVDKGLEVAPR